jgi:hypothetical protein
LPDGEAWDTDGSMTPETPGLPDKRRPIVRVRMPLAVLGAVVAIAAGGCLGGGGAVQSPASSAVGPAESAAENPGGGSAIAGEPGNPCDRLMSAAEANQASGLTGFVTPMETTGMMLHTVSLACNYSDGYGSGSNVLWFTVSSGNFYLGHLGVMHEYANKAEWAPVPVQGLGVAAIWLGSAAGQAPDGDYSNTLWIDTGRAVVVIGVGLPQQWSGADRRTVAEAVAHIILPHL